jgi:hypothetical protein
MLPALSPELSEEIEQPIPHQTQLIIFNFSGKPVKKIRWWEASKGWLDWAAPSTVKT